MAEFKKVTVPMVGTVFVAFLGICLFSIQWADATIIKGIRTGSDQAYVRVVLETSAPLVPNPKISVNRNTVRITLSGVENDPSALQSDAFRDDVAGISVIHTSSETRIDTILSFAPTKVRTFLLVDPHRFVIDAYRPATKTDGNPSGERLQPISIIGETDTNSDEKDGQHPSAQRAELGKSPESPGMPQAAGYQTSRSTPKRFQQRLLVFLIIVTSILLVVIIFLMCIDKQGKQHRKALENMENEERPGGG